MHKYSPLFLFVVVLSLMAACSGKPVAKRKEFYDVDSLISLQIENLTTGKYELNKEVEIGGAKEQTRFTPDSLQWSNELDIFRQLDQINKASFRDAYTINETRDTNSNLTIREIRSQRPVPVSEIRFFYLNTPNDLRKIEAVWSEENPLYTNARRLTIEFEPSNRLHVVHRYRIEGFQKMVMDDSVRFVIAGEVAM